MASNVALYIYALYTPAHKVYIGSRGTFAGRTDLLAPEGKKTLALLKNSVLSEIQGTTRAAHLENAHIS